MLKIDSKHKITFIIISFLTLGCERQAAGPGDRLDLLVVHQETRRSQILLGAHSLEDLAGPWRARKRINFSLDRFQARPFPDSAA